MINAYSVNMDVFALKNHDLEFVTMQLESGNSIWFQVDTGAECNVLPLHIYKLATADVKLANIHKYDSCITTYREMWYHKVADSVF